MRKINAGSSVPAIGASFIQSRDREVSDTLSHIILFLVKT